MTVTYKTCDICGQRMTDGCVINVRYRSMKDGKHAQSQKRIDVCDDCWKAINELVESGGGSGEREEGASRTLPRGLD